MAARTNNNSFNQYLNNAQAAQNQGNTQPNNSQPIILSQPIIIRPDNSQPNDYPAPETPPDDYEDDYVPTPEPQPRNSAGGRPRQSNAAGVPGRINNRLDAERKPSNLTKGASRGRASSGGTVDSQLKAEMLANNRDREPNGVYQRKHERELYYPYSYDNVRTQMLQKLSRRFVEQHTVEMTHVPFNWQITKSGTFYGLKLKMCQIQKIHYDFDWGSSTGEPIIPNYPSVVESPEKCLKVDFSLNDISELPYQALSPFRELRHLDASLNRIENYQGVEVCEELVILNLSHNFIRTVAHLSGLHSLIELNLSMNEIRDISLMPTLSNLTVLHINNNRLTSLDGIQSLSRLTELNCQKNKIENLAPLATSFTLRVLNASDNSLSSLHDTLVVLQALSNLQYLYLHDNKIALERNYATAVKQLTTVHVLDNVPVRPDQMSNQFTLPVLNNRQHDDLGGIRHATEHVFKQQIENHKRKTMSYINQLQLRIRELQEDYVNYENRLNRDLTEVMKYYDSFQHDAVEAEPGTELIDLGEKPWGGLSLTQRRDNQRRTTGRPRGKENNRNANLKALRDPQSILQNASTILQQDSERRSSAGYSRPPADDPYQPRTRNYRPAYITRDQFDDI